MDDIRYYNIFNKISDSIETMTKEELNSALQILIPFYTEFYTRHFENKEQINVKAMIKTFEELVEVAAERKLFLERAEQQQPKRVTYKI